MIKISRIPKKDINSNFVHIMVQGINKMFIFEKDFCKKKYFELMQENSKENNVEILAYCIMGNHAHILVFAENIYNLSKTMSIVNTKFSKWYNYCNDRCGVVFRNRYRTEPIYNEKYLLNCMNYIHNNPVKAKIVNKPENYKFSSYNDYCNYTGVYNNSILQEMFGKNWNYKEFEKECFDLQFAEAEGDELTEEEINCLIINATAYYKKMRNRSIADIFSDVIFLQDLIEFLKKDCKVSYLKIAKFFEMSKYCIANMKR